MKKVFFISICFALINLSFVNPPHKFIIAGYLMKFQKLDFNTLPYFDRIYYFSVSPDSEGNLFLNDDFEKNVSSLKEKLSSKQELFLVVGGWTESKNIPLLSADEN